MSKYLTRQDLARMTELSEDVIRRSEAAFGLLPFRKKVSRRCVRYVRDGAEKALRERGLIQ